MNANKFKDTLTDSVTASKAYSDAQDALKETIIKAYSDEKISEAENRSIIDATNKADAAKTYATAQDNLLKIQLEAYADGQIDIEEAARIQQAQNNLAAAKAYSDAQDNLAKIAANAYADGVVDAEEARAIADATAKMETAKNHAQTLVNNVQVGGRNLILQSKKTPVEMGGGASLQLEAGGFQLTNATEYCKWNTSNVQQGLLILSFKIKRLEGQGDGRNIRFYNGTGYEEIPNTSNITTETIVTHQFTNSGNFEKLYMTFLTGRIEISWLQLESGNKSTDWTPAPEDVDNKIKQNEQQTALAMAQANNAQNTANRVSQLTSFMNTTVDGNVVASGTMLVGDVNGGNAGMTGVTDRGSDSVRFFLGTNYANKNKAPLAFIDKGLIQMHHPNGVLGFEMGIVNGKLVFNVYDNSGNKTMEMGSQGIIFSNYIPDSWDSYTLLTIPAGSTNTDADLENFLRGQLNITTHQNDTEGWCNVDLNQNTTYWRYSAGVSYDSANYKQYEKFYYDTDNSKQKPGPSTPKKWDGWYAMPAHAQGSDAPVGGMSNWSITILCIRLAGGDQVQTKNISMSGSEFIHP